MGGVYSYVSTVYILWEGVGVGGGTRVKQAKRTHQIRDIATT